MGGVALVIVVLLVSALWFKRTGVVHDRAFTEQQARLKGIRSAGASGASAAGSVRDRTSLLTGRSYLGLSVFTRPRPKAAIRYLKQHLSWMKGSLAREGGFQKVGSAGLSSRRSRGPPAASRPTSRRSTDEGRPIISAAPFDQD